MSWTKLQLITEAYAELAMQGYVFDLTPEDLQAALRRMDTMMAVWEGRGVQLGYDFPPSPDESDINGESGLPDTAVEPVYLNLAVRLGPGLGKAVSIDTRRIAAEGFDALLRYAAQPTATQTIATRAVVQNSRASTTIN